MIGRQVYFMVFCIAVVCWLVAALFLVYRP